MKTQIRNNVFETNSSSVHAICIAKKKPKEFPEYVAFLHGAYGWENNTYTGIDNRASYLYQLICDFCDEDEKKKTKYLNKLYKLLTKHGIECDFDTEDYDDWEYNGHIHKSKRGYVDHHTAAIEFFDAVMHSDSKLLRFLFSDDSLIITGNDNISDYEESVFDKLHKLDYGNYEIYFKGN